ncbi:hypothetical protein BN381_50150 [Candidatus Microthrix parvicella RN1]|uniref:Uncharacterized protein n=1 Tax=Candidatus Neomicrothrix parvicella RN1 TaxID=1229780 RepID=R4Z2Q1_9ACTN|nr:hypothetical protein BN381_50150 [Candidatus Microthrix parvicella RN1]
MRWPAGFWMRRLRRFPTRPTRLEPRPEVSPASIDFGPVAGVTYHSPPDEFALEQLDVEGAPTWPSGHSRQSR